MNNFVNSEIWKPCEDLFLEQKDNNYAVIILNTPISFTFSQELIRNLWNQAKVKVTVDGGTHRWLQWLTVNNECDFQENMYPDLITGDMDSLPKEVLSFFQKGNSKIVVTLDQNETDFTKALRELHKYCSRNNKQIDRVYVLADTCGRLDQIMANINTLFKARDIMGSIKIFQLASTSLTWLLSVGQHSISIPIDLRNNQEWCSLIPVGAPCCVSSTGLKWNLDNTKLEFGSLVSTSNTYDGTPLVKIKTDGPLIWSMGIDFPLLKPDMEKNNILLKIKYLLETSYYFLKWRQFRVLFRT